MVGCRTSPVGHITYRWDGPGELSTLELPAVEEPLGFSTLVQPTFVTPADGATITPRGFAGVQPGAELHFSVGVTLLADPGSDRSRLEYQLLADREAAPRVLDTVEVFVFGDDDCAHHPSSE
ncbi:MAG: hypothetical protein GWO22_10055 [Actinobacteria bacterium]|nr:hypothetical protein [Actinomycetota bacterium]